MSKMVPVIFFWVPGADAVACRVRVFAAGEPFSYDKVQAVPDIAVTAPGAELVLDLRSLGLPDGSYVATVTDLDNAGDESDPFSSDGVTIKSAPPAPPVSGGLRSKSVA